MYSIKIDKGILWLNFFLKANRWKFTNVNIILIKKFVFGISSGTKHPVFLFEHVFSCSACLHLPKIVLLSSHLVVSDRNVHRKALIGSRRWEVQWLQARAGQDGECLLGLGNLCLSPGFFTFHSPPVGPAFCSSAFSVWQAFFKQQQWQPHGHSRLSLPIQFSVRRREHVYPWALTKILERSL